MTEGLYFTHDLEWLGIDLLKAVSELTVTMDRSQQKHAYLAGAALEAMQHQVMVVQDARHS